MAAEALKEMLDTARLTLLPCTPAHLLALIERPEDFERLVGLPVADVLPGFYTASDVSQAWLKVPPDSAGMVEIAYGIVPSFAGQGYATEAAAELVRFALASGEIRLLRAHTLPVANASTRVLAKCGFHHTGTVVDPDDGPVWRWERAPSP